MHTAPPHALADTASRQKRSRLHPQLRALRFLPARLPDVPRHRQRTRQSARTHLPGQAARRARRRRARRPREHLDRCLTCRACEIRLPVGRRSTARWSTSAASWSSSAPQRRAQSGAAFRALRAGKRRDAPRALHAADAGRPGPASGAARALCRHSCRRASASKPTTRTTGRLRGIRDAWPCSRVVCSPGSRRRSMPRRRVCSTGSASRWSRRERGRLLRRTAASPRPHRRRARDRAPQRRRGARLLDAGGCRGDRQHGERLRRLCEGLRPRRCVTTTPDAAARRRTGRRGDARPVRSDRPCRAARHRRGGAARQRAVRHAARVTAVAWQAPCSLQHGQRAATAGQGRGAAARGRLRTRPGARTRRCAAVRPVLIRSCSRSCRASCGPASSTRCSASDPT